MSNNNDDFWSKKENEDFWNKPVATDDWLKAYQKKQDEKEAADSVFSDNLNFNTAYTDSTVYNEAEQGEAFNSNPYLQQEEKKKTNVHGIIRIIFLAVTITVIILLFVSFSLYKYMSAGEIHEIAYSEQDAEGKFVSEWEGTFIMPEQAYTLVEADSQFGLPVNEKLILLPISYEAKEGSDYSNDRKLACYIGYEEDGSMIYKQSLQERNVYPYVSYLGFEKGQIINSGELSAFGYYHGFLCYCVPEEINEIIFYVEEQSSKYNILITTGAYKDEIMIVQKESSVVEQLIKEE